MWKMVIMIRESDPYDKAVAQKYRLKELLNEGYKIERCDAANGILVYILNK